MQQYDRLRTKRSGAHHLETFPTPISVEMHADHSELAIISAHFVVVNLNETVTLVVACKKVWRYILSIHTLYECS